MLFWLFLLLRGDEFLLFLFAMLMYMRSHPDEIASDPVDSTFIEEVDFMFPENFLSRYPHEANPFRFKIFSYLIFNLLVKGYGSVDPPRFWSNYNRDDFYRIAIDAAFYEYFTNFTDREAKDLLFNPLEDMDSNLENPASNEEIAVDRIGQYLDLLAENKSEQEINGGIYIISESTEFPTMPKLRIPECYRHTPIQTSGTPGIDYPNFCDIPETSFRCANQKKPGIYADYEAGCQVFHICWGDRQDTFLCPIGTIFNQSLLTCDIWHETGCFSSPSFHHDLIEDCTELDVSNGHLNCEELLGKCLRARSKFLPAECEVQDLMGGRLKPVLRNQQRAVGLTTIFLEFFNGIDEMLKIPGPVGRRLRQVIKERAAEIEAKRLVVLNKLTEILEMPELKGRGRSMNDRSAEIEAQLHVLRNDIIEMFKLFPGFEVLDAEIETRHPRRRIFPKFSNRNSDETEEEDSKFARKLGDADFQAQNDVEQEAFRDGFQVGLRSCFSVTKKFLEENLESPKRRDMLETAMKSLGLGGAISNEGVIPLAKKIMMDSYRQIEPKKR